MTPKLLWTPSAERADGASIARFARAVGRDPYEELWRWSVEDLDGLLASLAQQGIEPEKPPYSPGGREGIRICFVADPDGYRIELIDGDFATPQDPDPA